MGNPQITGDALTYALDLGMPVHYLTYFGKYLGSALPGYSRNSQLRLAQFELYRDTEKRLELVKAIVAAKIHNQRSLLYRHDQKNNPLKLRKSQVEEQETLNQIRGIEGMAAREYFSYWNDIKWTQYSVFECFLTNMQFVKLQHQIENLIKPETDSVRIYVLDATAVKKAITYGSQKPKHEDTIIL